VRRAAALTLALTLACSTIPAAAQQKPGPESARGAERSSVGARSVTGTVKKTTDNGFVVVGHEAGKKDTEWAFALDPATRIDAGGQMKGANELREGDAVTVTYTNRDGKIVAQTVKVTAP
jgi:Cu/Ag efflux protein CusF